MTAVRIRQSQCTGISQDFHLRALRHLAPRRASRGKKKKAGIMCISSTVPVSSPPSSRGPPASRPVTSSRPRATPAFTPATARLAFFTKLGRDRTTVIAASALGLGLGPDRPAASPHPDVCPAYILAPRRSSPPPYHGRLRRRQPSRDAGHRLLSGDTRKLQWVQSRSAGTSHRPSARLLYPAAAHQGSVVALARPNLLFHRNSRLPARLVIPRPTFPSVTPPAVSSPYLARPAIGQATAVLHPPRPAGQGRTMFPPSPVLSTLPVVISAVVLLKAGQSMRQACVHRLPSFASNRPARSSAGTEGNHNHPPAPFAFDTPIALG